MKGGEVCFRSLSCTLWIAHLCTSYIFIPNALLKSDRFWRIARPFIYNWICTPWQISRSGKTSRFRSIFAIFTVFFATEISANKIDLLLFATHYLLIKVKTFSWCFSLNTVKLQCKQATLSCDLKSLYYYILCFSDEDSLGGKVKWTCTIDSA